MCDEPTPDDHVCFGDEASEYAGQLLCEICYYEDEPVATVYYGSDDEPHYINHLRNDIEGDFWVSWHSTDPMARLLRTGELQVCAGLL